MSNKIHKTAIVGPKVKLGKNIGIGPYAVINGQVTLGDDITIGAHCVVEGDTKIGNGCQIFTGAVIGSPPQDRKHQKKDKVILTIGTDNVFREYVTVNPGTIEGGAETLIGNHNLFMACCHVAHDCHIGNDCVLANYVGLSGHVTIEDRAIIGGCSKVNQDVPPFSLVDGNPATLRGLNIVGLKRAEYSSEVQRSLHHVFKILFNSGLNRSNAVLQVKKQLNGLPEVHRVIDFIQTSKRGIS